MTDYGKQAIRRCIENSPDRTEHKELVLYGLKKAAGATRRLQGYYGGHNIQIDYDTATGEILIEEHVGCGWLHRSDKGVIHITTTFYPMTMAEIADMIRAKLAEWKACERAVAAMLASAT